MAPDKLYRSSEKFKFKANRRILNKVSIIGNYRMPIMLNIEVSTSRTKGSHGFFTLSLCSMLRKKNFYKIYYLYYSEFLVQYSLFAF